MDALPLTVKVYAKPTDPLTVRAVTAVEIIEAVVSPTQEDADWTADNPEVPPWRERVELFEIEAPDGLDLIRRIPELENALMAGWRLFVVTHL